VLVFWDAAERPDGYVAAAARAGTKSLAVLAAATRALVAGTWRDRNSDVDLARRQAG